MTEHISITQLQQLFIRFREKKEKQIDMQVVHEQSENFGMAYLALWAIMEDFATRLGPVCQRADLKKSLQEWLTFLSEEMLTTPTKISSGKFDLAKEATAKIPPISLLKVLLETEAAPNFYELLDPEKKYRKRRNLIAHSGEGVSKKVHEEFKGKILLALNEIEIWLGAAIKARVESVDK
jgi:hypothetical protein